MFVSAWRTCDPECDRHTTAAAARFGAEGKSSALHAGKVAVRLQLLECTTFVVFFVSRSSVDGDSAAATNYAHATPKGVYFA